MARDSSIRNQSPRLHILGFLLPAIDVGQPPPCHGTATALPTLAPDGRRCGPLSVACQRLSPVSELPPAELDREICSHLRMFQKRRHTAGWESSVGPAKSPASGQCLGVFCQLRGFPLLPLTSLCADVSPVRPLKRIDCDWPMGTLADSGSCIWAFLACVIAARSRSPPNDRSQRPTVQSRPSLELPVHASASTAPSKVG
jgi:hypothetical protein